MLWGFFGMGKPAIDVLLKEIKREDEKEEAVKVYRSNKPEIHLYDGVVEMLQELRSKGIKIGIITDGRPEGQRNKIDALGLKELVDDIIITDELGGVLFRKPCDIAFRIIQNRWRLSAGEIVYVADNPIKDFQAPQKLEMKSIWFRNADGIYNSKVINNEDKKSIGRLSDLEEWI